MINKRLFKRLMTAFVAVVMIFNLTMGFGNTTYAFDTDLQDETSFVDKAVKDYLSSKGKYPTSSGELPPLGEFLSIELDLIKEYLIDLSLLQGQQWFIDSEGKVYSVDLDSLKSESEETKEEPVLEEEQEVQEELILEEPALEEPFEEVANVEVLNATQEESVKTPLTTTAKELFKKNNAVDVKQLLNEEEGTKFETKVETSYSLETPIKFILNPASADNTAPVVILATDNSLKNKHTVFIDATDDSGYVEVYYTWTDNADFPEGFDYYLEENPVVQEGLNGTYYLHVMAIDMFGNMTVAYTVRHFDSIAPVISLSGADYLKHRHEVEVSSVDKDIVDLMYEVSKSENIPAEFTNAASSHFIVTGYLGKYYVHVRAEDEAGNYGYSKILLDFSDIPGTGEIDKGNAPVINIFDGDDKDKIAKSHTVEFSVEDEDDDLLSVHYTWTNSTQIPTGGWIDVEETYSSTKSDGTGKYYFYVKAIDSKGNIAHAFTTRIFDNEDPDIFIPKNAVYSKTHTVNVQVSDKVSGLDAVQAAWASSEEIPTTGWKDVVVNNGMFTFAGSGFNGKQFLHVKVTDSSGNESNTVQERFFDNTEPEIGIIILSEGQVLFAAEILGTDEHSGVDKVEYLFTETIAKPRLWGVVENGSVVNLKPQVNHMHLHVKVRDKAGNESYMVKSIGYELAKPSISLSEDDKYAKSHSVVVSATDPKGISKVEYAWSKTTDSPTSWTPVQNGERVTKSDGTGSFYLHVKATNIYGLTTTKYVLRNFDNTAPKIHLPFTDKVQSTHTIKINATDEHSGVKKVEYTWSLSSLLTNEGWETIENGDSISLTINKNTTRFLFVRVTDHAGNFSKSFTLVCFEGPEATKPTIVFSPDSTKEWAKSHTVKITADSEIGISKVEYQWSRSQTPSDKSWTAISNGSTVTKSKETGVFWLHARAVDNKGNVVSESTTRKLDNNGPKISSTGEDAYFYKKSRSFKIHATDNESGVAKLEYAWQSAYSKYPPSYVKVSTSGTTIQKSGVSGIYRLYIRATDHAGNVTVTCIDYKMMK